MEKNKSLDCEGHWGRFSVSGSEKKTLFCEKTASKDFCWGILKHFKAKIGDYGQSFWLIDIGYFRSSFLMLTSVSICSCLPLYPISSKLILLITHTDAAFIYLFFFSTKRAEKIIGQLGVDLRGQLKRHRYLWHGSDCRCL